MSASHWSADEAAAWSGTPENWDRALEEFFQAGIDGTLPRPHPCLIVGPQTYAMIEERAAQRGLTADEYVSHLVVGTLTPPEKCGTHK